MPYGKCDDKFWKHEKVKALADRHRLAAIGLYWRAISYCNDALTDGRLRREEVMGLAGAKYRVLSDELVRVGLWERDGKDFLVHDFLSNLDGTAIPFNYSREAIEAKRARNTEAGRLGAESRWHVPVDHAGFGWGPSWQPLSEAWYGRGFRKPPTEKQRELLWPIVDARPNDAAKWLRSAPPGSAPFEAVKYVIGKWRQLAESVA